MNVQFEFVVLHYGEFVALRWHKGPVSIVLKASDGIGASIFLYHKQGARFLRHHKRILEKLKQGTLWTTWMSST